MSSAAGSSRRSISSPPRPPSALPPPFLLSTRRAALQSRPAAAPLKRKSPGLPSSPRRNSAPASRRFSIPAWSPPSAPSISTRRIPWPGLKRTLGLLLLRSTRRSICRDRMVCRPPPPTRLPLPTVAADRRALGISLDLPPALTGSGGQDFFTPRFHLFPSYFPA